jgi:hypothetical protein
VKTDDPRVKQAAFTPESEVTRLMEHDDNESESATRLWRDGMPCCANVWDARSESYRRCDEMADPASDSDLCTRHEERLTDIVSRITTAITTARAREGALQPADGTVP